MKAQKCQKIVTFCNLNLPGTTTAIFWGVYFYTHTTVILNWGQFALMGHLAVSGELLFITAGVGVLLTSSGEKLDATKHAQDRPPPPKKNLVQNSAEVRHLHSGYS